MRIARISVHQPELQVPFEKILPEICAIWWSMGNCETLAHIGRVLDTMPIQGVGTPAWEAAEEIASAHHEWVKQGGGYAREYERNSTGYYAPGLCVAAPVPNGYHSYPWGFSVQLTAAVGRTVTVYIACRGRSNHLLTVDFGPQGSERSADAVVEILNSLKIPYCIEEVPEASDFEDEPLGVGDRVYSPAAETVGSVSEIYEDGVPMIVCGENPPHADPGAFRIPE